MRHIDDSVIKFLQTMIYKCCLSARLFVADKSGQDKASVRQMDDSRKAWRKIRRRRCHQMIFPRCLRIIVSHRTDVSAKFRGRDARGEMKVDRECAGGAEEVM